MTVVPFRPPSPAPVSNTAPDAAAARYAAAARAPATHRAYAADWRAWSAWAGAHDVDVDRAADGDIAAYLASRADAGAAPASIARAAAGIRAEYRARGAAPMAADTEAVIRDIRRARAAPQRRAAPTTADMLRSILDAIPAPAAMADKRDRALLCLGWQTAMRRGEIVSLDWNDWSKGLANTVTLRASKGARDGAAVTIPVVPARRAGACPIRALRTLARAMMAGRRAPRA